MLLIDGYNLLHATDIFGEGTGPGYFQRSREALIAFLGSSLTDSERPQTTIVFDAADAPPGLPNHYTIEDITIVFACDYPDADTLLEEMIEDHSAPRGLRVVSSDHRVQRAARRRGAKYADSERWYSELWQRRVELRRSQHKAVPEKPVRSLNSDEIAYWVEQFEVSDQDSLPARDAHASPETESSTNESPFPPGYCDDLFTDDGES